MDFDDWITKDVKNVLLVEPNFPIPNKSRNHSNFLPIGLLKIAAYLREKSINVKLIRFDEKNTTDFAQMTLDLNYNDENSRASKEQKDKNVRPEIAGEELNISDYAIIYLGYPIWFGQAPRIMNTFIESHSFENRIIFPFCTSASSGIGESANDLKSSAKTGNWMDGMRFSSDATEEQIQSWINGSNL